MTVIPGWHPAVVHFPLALVVTGALALGAARVLRDESAAGVLATVGTWNLCLGAIGVFFALGTGLAAVIGLNIDLAAHRAITSHVKSAVITTLLVTLVAVWRGAATAANSRPSGFILLMLGAATAALLVTGYRGGQNVYQHGIGVAVEPRMTPARAPLDRAAP